jgi:hypothetical protein
MSRDRDRWGDEGGGQRFSWQGKEIPPTVFEVAVAIDELTEAEEAWLRK